MATCKDWVSPFSLYANHTLLVLGDEHAGNFVENWDKSLDANYIWGGNADFVGEELAKLPFDCPCLIYLSGCNSGVAKGENTWPQIIADKTGCTVKATGGFMSGTVFDGTCDIHRYHNTWGPDWFNDYCGTGSRYHENEKTHAGQNGKWFTFQPAKPRVCDDSEPEPPLPPSRPREEPCKPLKPRIGPVK